MLYVLMAILIHIHTREEHMGHTHTHKHTRLIRDKRKLNIHGHSSKSIKHSINQSLEFSFYKFQLREGENEKGKYRDIKLSSVSFRYRKDLPLQIFREQWKPKSRMSSWYLFESVQSTVTMVMDQRVRTSWSNWIYNEIVSCRLLRISLK